MKDDQLIFVDDDGTEVLCDILFTYYSEDFQKNYVFFYPAGSEEQDEPNDVEVGCASYVPTDGAIGELTAVENDEEWVELTEVFNSYMNSNNDCGCGCDDCDDCDEDCDDDDCEECSCCGHDH